MLCPTWEGPTLVGGMTCFWIAIGDNGNGVVWEGCGQGF